MDGRPQRKVADYLATSFGVRSLDTITTAGTVRHLAGDTEQTPILLDNLRISIEAHGSSQVAVVAHHDCAGNPVPDKTQIQQVRDAMAWLRDIHPGVEVIGLWLDEHGLLERVRLS